MEAAFPLHARSLFLYRHRGNAKRNHEAPLQDRVHLPTYHGREHEHPSSEFLVVGTVVTSGFIPLPAAERQQPPLIARRVMLQSAIAVQT